MRLVRKALPGMPEERFYFGLITLGRVTLPPTRARYGLPDIF